MIQITSDLNSECILDEGRPLLVVLLYTPALPLGLNPSQT